MSLAHGSGVWSMFVPSNEHSFQCNMNLYVVSPSAPLDRKMKWCRSYNAPVVIRLIAVGVWALWVKDLFDWPTFHWRSLFQTHMNFYGCGDLLWRVDFGPKVLKSSFVVPTLVRSRLSQTDRHKVLLSDSRSARTLYIQATFERSTSASYSHPVMSGEIYPEWSAVTRQRLLYSIKLSWSETKTRFWDKLKSAELDSKFSWWFTSTKHGWAVQEVPSQESLLWDDRQRLMIS